MQRIGITERGDASLSFDWVSKMHTVSGAILVTKNITDKFIREVMNYKTKVIIHATVTGWGGTPIEPNAPSLQESYIKIQSLVELGFPVEQIVLRIDPVIATTDGLLKLESVLDRFKDSGIIRVRFSFLDKYKHVVERFKLRGLEKCLPLYSYDKPFISSISETFKVFEKYKDVYTFEACSEDLPYNDNIMPVGCISKIDMDILNLNVDLIGNAKQRTKCLCPSNKLELLNSRHPCMYGCLYCYWRD